MTIKKILLLGGGHTHVLVLKNLMGKRFPHHVTLINEDRFLIYTGMLPGFIAGHYGLQEIRVDLSLLCRRAREKGVRVNFVEASLKSIKENSVITDKGDLSYHLASLNLGVASSVPDSIHKDYSLSLKPMGLFVSKWQNLYRKLSGSEKNSHIAVIGGGAGGLEVALALAWRFRFLPIKISLITVDSLLPNYAEKLVSRARYALEQAKIRLWEYFRAQDFQDSKLSICSVADSSVINEVAADYVFWSTHGVPPSWLKCSPLACDETGFVKVNRFLQSVSHPNIFAAGDLASFEKLQLAKAGVFAVRQAPYITRNLMAKTENGRMVAYYPQKHFLTLLSLGQKKALGQRGYLCFSGVWVWQWKNYLDRDFINRLTA